MKSQKIYLARISRGCMERTEIGTWLVQCYADPIVDPGTTLHALDVVDVEPTSVARNRAVLRARAQKCDVLMMIDNDMTPDLHNNGDPNNFYNRACRFLADNEGKPVAFGAPYRGAAPKREVQVGDYGRRVTVEEAATKRHIDQVIGMGTGLFAANMAAFDAIEKAGLLPWFDYEYADPPYNSLILATEDFHFFNKLNKAGGKVYCDWESWAGHAKVEIVGKPETPLKIEEVAVDGKAVKV